MAAGALPDGTPVIISGGGDGTVRVWRMADGTPVGEPLAGHTAGGGGGGRGAAGRHPGHHQRRPRRHGAGVAAGRRRPGRRAAARPRRPGVAVAAGALPDGTPVIISGGEDGTVRVWRLADGTPVGEPLRGHAGGCTRWRPGRCRTAPRSSSAAAATARCGCGGWPTAPGRRAAGRPRRQGVRGGGRGAAGRHPVIISAGEDGTVRVWRTADGTPLVPPLDLSEPVRAVAVHGDVIITAAGADIAVHQPALPQPRR